MGTQGIDRQERVFKSLVDQYISEGLKVQLQLIGARSSELSPDQARGELAVIPEFRRRVQGRGGNSFNLQIVFLCLR